jgi:hypothetical protein
LKITPRESMLLKKSRFMKATTYDYMH